MIYDTNYVCLYENLLNDEVFEEGETEEEKNEIRQYTYRRDLRGIFGCLDEMTTETFEELMNEKMKQIYEQIGSNNYIQEAINILKQQHPLLDGCADITFLMILFSYHFLWMSEKCFHEFFTKGSISEENGKGLIECVEGLKI